MNIIIERKFFCKDYIIGDVYLENKYTFVCNSLEPSLVASHPAIPCGSYPITFVFSHKFNRYMPFVDGVKGRTGIMIHTGNSPKDTKGCILLGNNSSKGCLTDSKECFNPLRALLIQSIIDSNENCFLIVKNK